MIKPHNKEDKIGFGKEKSLYIPPILYLKKTVYKNIVYIFRKIYAYNTLVKSF